MDTLTPRLTLVVMTDASSLRKSPAAFPISPASR